MPDPKDPWGRRQDGVDDALRHVRDQFRQLPTGGIRSLLIAAVFLVVVWQGTFIVKPDEEGVVKRFIPRLKEYEQARDIFSKRLYTETMEAILPILEKIILGGKAGERMLPYL